MIKRGLFLFIIIGIIYSRFQGLSWGLPYPMHPDERNMANAVQQLNCEVKNTKHNIPNNLNPISFQNLQQCFNPHFYAYGQLPLYLAYLFIQFWHFLIGRLGDPINFLEATVMLRFISALSSFITVWVMYMIINIIQPDFHKKYINILSPFAKNHGRKPADESEDIFASEGFLSRRSASIRTPERKLEGALSQGLIILALSFTPYFIQLSHFGTTESLLMLFYTLLIYLCLKIITDQKQIGKNIFFASIILGLSIGTKISSFMFAPILICCLLYVIYKKNKTNLITKLIFTNKILIIFIATTVFFTIISSPFMILSYSGYMGTFNYESSIGLGNIIMFYSRQFKYTLPFIFHTVKIFPYALGIPSFILAVIAFIALSWRDKYVNLLRLAFILFFIPSAFLYAKWTRFVSPIFPLLTIFTVLLLLSIYSSFIDYLSKLNLKHQKKLYDFAFCILIFALIMPGVAYLSVYINPDVRFTASKWIYNNIKNDSLILSETGNVIDIPLHVLGSDPLPYYNVISFDFYHLHENIEIQNQLEKIVPKSNYIIIPSRRIISNHTCIDLETYSFVNEAIDKQNSKLSNIINGYQSDRCDKLEAEYPVLNIYYKNLLSGKLGFKQVAEITNYPKITLFGKTLVEYKDENAEETWSVFDHPVIRIFQRT